jgi:hypothetical protein
MTLLLAEAASGVARSAHYIVPTGGTVPIQTLLLEPQRTNLCIRSEEFDTWTAANTCNVTANAIAAPDGTMTADLLTATATNSERLRNVTFTSDGEKCVAIYLKAGTSGRSRIQVFDSTAAVNRHVVFVTWTGGVPSIATSLGSGTLYPVEALGNGWYRILFSVAGIVAANTNRVAVFPDNLVGTGTVYAWGAQAEDAVVPSSYIKTENTTVTRSADSLYFPFTAPPQAMTIYVRGVHRGTRYELGSYILQISGDNNQNPRVQINRPSATTPIHFQTVNAAGTFTTINPSGAEPVLGDLVEYRGILFANGNLGYGHTLNNGTESVSTVVTGTALEAAWAGTRLYVGTNGSGSAGLFAITHVVVAQGEQTMATMRQLAGVV